MDFTFPHYMSHPSCVDVCLFQELNKWAVEYYFLYKSMRICIFNEMKTFPPFSPLKRCVTTLHIAPQGQVLCPTSLYRLFPVFQHSFPCDHHRFLKIRVDLTGFHQPTGNWTGAVAGGW